MGVLAMLELEGDTADLMAASVEVDRRLPAPEGLLVRIAAPTEQGLVLFQLWESADARMRNAGDPAHAEALEVSGMKRVVRGMRSQVFEAAALRYAAPAETGA